MTVVSESAIAPLRVLVVENDPQWRADHLETLKSWDITPYAAEPAEDVADRFGSLWADAIDKARRYRCHVALVDMRLKNDDDPGDTSGLNLVPELAPTVSIIVSAYGDRKTVREALKSPLDVPDRAHDFVGKEDGPEALREAIEKAFGDHWPYLFSSVEIIPPSDLNQQNKISRDLSDDEVLDLLRQTFFNASRLRLESVRSTARPVGLSLRSHSLVLKATPDNEQTVVVKIARAMRVQEERTNYNQFVSPYFPGRFYARFKRPERMWNWGCSVYEFMGTIDPNMRLFTDYYVQESGKSICSALIRFGSNLGTLYTKTRQPSGSSLFVAYRDAWGDEWSQRLNSFRVAFTVPEVCRTWGLPDPISWIRERVNLVRPSERDATRTLDHLDTAIIHGDLHGENMFVDSNGDIWLIDYERSGRGPILQDWVELENDLLTRLIPLDSVDLSAYANLVIRLLSPSAIDGIVNGKNKLTPTRTDTSEIRKALTILRELRKTAKVTTGVEDVRLYLWSLLSNVVYRLMYWQEHVDDTPDNLARLQQCFLLGGLICHRLENFETRAGPWPPVGWMKSKPTDQTNSQQVILPQPTPIIKLQLTDLRNDQGEFKVAILDSPNKQPYANSAPPLRGDSLIAVMKLLEPDGYQLNAFSPMQLTALKQMKLLLEDNSLGHDWCDRIGHDLFDAIAPTRGGVRTEFENAFYKDRKGGELQLIFDKNATDLACQPWELLHDGFPDEPRTPIDMVRYIASGKTAQPLGVSEAPCQILYMTARPNGYAQTAHDRDAIKASVASSASLGRFAFEELPKSTHRELKQRLMDPSPPIHVLHFDGHGTFARLCRKCGTPNFSHELSCGKVDNIGKKCGASLANEPARGYLLFETDMREAEFIDTTKFLEGIQRSEVRLVVLSSCQSARVRGADLLLAGVGPGLILAGVPAVVAMQFSISDQNAIQFNREFYRALAQGDSLPSAVYRARTVLTEPARWSPVLYLRSRDHQIHLCPQR